MNIRSKTLLKSAVNLVFAVYNLVLGISSCSIWFISMGVYYMIFSFMRAAAFIFSAKNRKNEDLIMRLLGAAALLLSVLLCGIVYMTIAQFGAVKHPEIAMITIALYAFTKITLAICGFLKPSQSPCLKTLRSITLIDGVVSIYSLQRSMLVSFEGMTDGNIIILNTLSGIGMCLTVFIIGLNLIFGKENKNG